MSWTVPRERAEVRALLAALFDGDGEDATFQPYSPGARLHFEAILGLGCLPASYDYPISVTSPVYSKPRERIKDFRDYLEYVCMAIDDHLDVAGKNTDSAGAADSKHGGQ